MPIPQKTKQLPLRCSRLRFCIPWTFLLFMFDKRGCWVSGVEGPECTFWTCKHLSLSMEKAVHSCEHHDLVLRPGIDLCRRWISHRFTIVDIADKLEREHGVNWGEAGLAGVPVSDRESLLHRPSRLSISSTFLISNQNNNTRCRVILFPTPCELQKVQIPHNARRQNACDILFHVMYRHIAR